MSQKETPTTSQPNKGKKTPKLKRKEISAKRLENFKRDIVTDSHEIPLEALLSRFETHPTRGLSVAKAKARLLDNGPNALTPSHKDPEVVKFLKTIVHGFSLLLWVGAALCYTGCIIAYMYNGEVDTDNIILGSVLILIIIITGVFMYWQQRKTSKIMDSFATMIPQKTTVIRDGESIQINAKELVIGDLVEVKFGDRIPADIRIIKTQGFKVDNSSITGENEPLLRTNQCTNENILETKNVAFFSTSAIEGTAEGIVIMTGDNTVMGRIAGLTERLHAAPTPLARELKRFMTIVTIWACCLGVVIGVTSACVGYPWIDSALFLIGIIVSNVPEGLVATVTVSLTITAKKMALKNCMVKNLEAVETLGSTSVICSDKTGTLTQNRMTVCHLWYSNQVTNADTSPDQYDARRYARDDSFMSLMRVATLCNRATFAPSSDDDKKRPINSWEVIGDASEAAILKFVTLTQAHGDLEEFKTAHPKLIEVPFSSTTKYQMSVHAWENQCLLVMKGAPERILEKCKTIVIDDETIELTDSMRQTCDSACMELAARGERVLGFADLILKEVFDISYPFTVDPAPNFPTDGLRFVGFISLVDPPRPQVRDAVETCRNAGIKVIMVTGDHPVTAQAIAKEVGIITKDIVENAQAPMLSTTTDNAVVVSGSVLRDLSEEELDVILYEYNEVVFARTSPTQKLQIVEGLQRLGKIVAVTGDGVNDSPALKKADIGIAMGITGSDVSQQSADMILLDDNFASIVVGIEEGRKIFDNLKKSIVYVLASNVPELTPFLVFIIFSTPLPMGILAILCIDVLTDMMPAISLAYEKAESDIMLRPPRDPTKDNLVTFRLYYLAYGHIGIIESFAGFFVYFMIMYEYGFKPDKLFGLRPDWDNPSLNDLRDSYDQEWSFVERKRLEYTCSTAFMIAVVVCQWGDVMACKTRLNSIIKQGMTNWILNLSIVMETLLAIVLSYTPFMHHLKFYPVKFVWWLYAIPFAAFIVIFDEYRKFCIRRYKKGYFYRETYY